MKQQPRDGKLWAKSPHTDRIERVRADSNAGRGEIGWQVVDAKTAAVLDAAKAGEGRRAERQSYEDGRRDMLAIILAQAQAATGAYVTQEWLQQSPNLPRDALDACITAALSEAMPEALDVQGSGDFPPVHIRDNGDGMHRWECAGMAGHARTYAQAVFWAGWWVGRAKLARDVRKTLPEEPPGGTAVWWDE